MSTDVTSYLSDSDLSQNNFILQSLDESDTEEQ